MKYSLNKLKDSNHLKTDEEYYNRDRSPSILAIYLSFISMVVVLLLCVI